MRDDTVAKTDVSCNLYHAMELRTGFYGYVRVLDAQRVCWYPGRRHYGTVMARDEFVIGEIEEPLDNETFWMDVASILLLKLMDHRWPVTKVA